MIIAPGAVDFAEPLPNRVKANNTPKPGPGFASSRKRIERPVSLTCSVPNGVKMPWLIALFRKRIFAGSMKIFVKGINCAFRIVSTPAAIACVKRSTTGPIAWNPSSAKANPIKPAEKLLTSISKPVLIWLWKMASNFLIAKPPNGPMIMAPMIIGISVPTITPIVAMAPTTAPRSPAITLPPV